MGLTKQIGIMQGRLSPRIDGKIQAYPAKTWQKEFEIAQEIGYSAIEWIVEKPLEINAMMSKSGMTEIKEIILKTGVRVDYVCADIFMQQPLVRMTEESKFTFKIPRYAELLLDTYIVVTLPTIWSPIIPPQDIDGVWAPYDFRWIENLGTMMIKDITISVGGQMLQKFTGKYLLALIQRDFTETQKK